jgi:hypothetical protein
VSTPSLRLLGQSIDEAHVDFASFSRRRRRVRYSHPDIARLTSHPLNRPAFIYDIKFLFDKNFLFCTSLLCNCDCDLNMPPQQLDNAQENQQPMRRVGSESDMSEAGDAPRNAREYKVRKSSLIG